MQAFTLAWVKAQDGKPCNEAADILQKQATSEGQQIIYIPAPRSYLIKRLGEISSQKWQIQWDTGKTGGNIYQIQPKVQTTPIPWQRSEIHFTTGHGPFPTYLHRFHLKSTDFCGCDEQGSPIHYSTECPLTSSYTKFNPKFRLHQFHGKDQKFILQQGMGPFRLISIGSI
ncbi:hypothetical protein AVEN_91059-1 [Araneus ventricosus]|uniref:RNase H type-1 domain-containing protein n=1 Tax=Araneus ventricosus TaxID=182803 RepID=A0A4Y2KTJ8_ARAVE|nr:hypothetical protein AVEN_91059-1 [Araneus ventricosus]